jgi:hypothetical protein
MSRNFELLTQIEKELGDEVDKTSDAVRSSAPDLVSLTQTAPGGTAEVNRLVERIFFPASATPHHHVIFCGIEATNASSFIAAQVARTLAARSREKVCLIDAHPSNGGVSGIFGTPLNPEEPQIGLIAESCVPVASDLWLLRWPSTIAGSERPLMLRSRFTELQQTFSYILIDAPGCLLNDDATMWAPVSDAAILVVEAGATRRVAVRQAKQKLETAGARLAGTVLHNRSFPVPKALYDRL